MCPSPVITTTDCGESNSCNWAHDVWFNIAGTNRPKRAQQAKQGLLMQLITSDP